MNTYINILIVVLFTFVASSSLAGETLVSYGNVDGRSYHEDHYEEEQCVACHDSTEPSGLPADNVCVSCHDLDDLVTSTARTEDEQWQNPHDNMHWGKDVPCMECHGEHQESKPLCQGCHSFKYPSYKP